MVDSTLNDEIKMTLKMQKMEISKIHNNEQSRLRYAKRVQENPEFYKQEKIRIREYNRNRYAIDPEFAERLKSKRREVYRLKKEAKLSA
jgi:hypothetical protein